MYLTSRAAVDITSARAPMRMVDLGRRGRGVLATEAIVRGALIERAPVIVVPEADRIAVDGSAVGYHIFMWEHDSVGDDLYSQKGRAALVLGFASLFNHSPDPNCEFVRYIDAMALDIIALRDIAADEELTFNYGMTLWFTPD